MKNKFLYVSLSLLSCAALCACGGEGTSSTNNGALAAVSNISINYSDSTYSFTGVENASSYYIKVYTVTNGVEDSVLTYMSDKIAASSDLSQTGTLDYSFLCGTYNAYIQANGSGYTSSTSAAYQGQSYRLNTPSLTAYWQTETVDEVESVTGVKITASSADSIVTSFTINILDAGSLVVYTNAEWANGAGEVVLTASDLGADSLSTDDVYTVTLDVNTPGSEYVLPGQVTTTISTEQTGGWPGGGWPM